MKKKVLNICIFAGLIILITFFSKINLFESTESYYKKCLNLRSVNVWESIEDRILAETIETDILNKYNNVTNSKSVYIITDIKNICYSLSIYSDTHNILKELNIKNKFLNEIDEKKDYLYYAGDNASVIILVKSDNTLIPIFTNLDFINIKSNLYSKEKFGCEYVENNKVKIILIKNDKKVDVVIENLR